MNRSIPILVATAMAASGCQHAARHNGYPKGVKAPWQAAAELKIVDNEAEGEAVLSYPERRRSAWWTVDTPKKGDLEIQMAVTPLSASVREDFDVAFEVFDASFNVLVRADIEAEDATEPEKQRTLGELEPGHYYIHAYLQDRRDDADVEINLVFYPTTGHATVDLPLVGAMPIVPAIDYVGYTPPAPTREPERPTRSKPKPVEKKSTSLSASIIDVTAASKGTRITLNRGAEHGVVTGMRGSIPGVKMGGFTVTKVGSRTSVVYVDASVDDVSKKRSATIMLD